MALHDMLRVPTTYAPTVGSTTTRFVAYVDAACAKSAACEPGADLVIQYCDRNKWPYCLVDDHEPFLFGPGPRFAAGCAPGFAQSTAHGVAAGIAQAIALCFAAGRAPGLAPD